MIPLIFLFELSKLQRAYQGLGVEENGDLFSMGIEFSFYKMKKDQKMNGGDGSTIS